MLTKTHSIFDERWLEEEKWTLQFLFFFRLSGSQQKFIQVDFFYKQIFIRNMIDETQ